MYRNYIEELNIRPDEVIEYLRKSRADDPSLSVEEVLARHEEILTDWVKSNMSAPIPESNKFREVVSGETIADRPEIQKVLKLIESPAKKAILVVEVQRLSRGDLEDCGRLMKLLRYTNTLVITPMKIYDLQDEYDRDSFERELKRGNDYLEYQKKILNRGRLLSVSQGNYIASVPPYGYDKVTYAEGKTKVHTLAINEEQANVVRMVFDMYGNQCMGRMAICHKLDEWGIKPPKGKQWSTTAVREMLRNVHYIGKVKYNWRKTVTIVSDGEFKKIRPQSREDEQLIFDGKHEAIISQELFDRVQQRLGNNPRVSNKAKLRNPFAGIVYCKNCGKIVIMNTYKGKCAPRMMCSDQSRCGSGSCTYDDLVERVCDGLQQFIDDFELNLSNEDQSRSVLQENIVKSLEKKLDEIHQRELSQWEAQSNPNEAQRMPPHIFHQLNARLLREKEDTLEALRKAKSDLEKHNNNKVRISQFKQAVTALKDPNYSDELKNNLLKSCISRIDYYKEKPLRNFKNEKNHDGDVTHGAWSRPQIVLDMELKVSSYH